MLQIIAYHDRNNANHTVKPTPDDTFGEKNRFH